MMCSLKGKVAVVTGGARGIGKAIAIRLAEDGADIALTYHGNKDKARLVCEEIQKMGRKCNFFYCDVSDFEGSANFISEVIKEFGTIDILVNNAGISGKDALAFALTSEDFDSVVGTNLKGTFNLCRHVYPVFVKKHGGKIINIASVAGISGIAGQSIYSASKAGIIGFTKAIAKELASRNITCNVVAPGFIETDMTESIKEKVKGSIPLARLGTPEEVANVVSFLANPNADYITGTVIKINGGGE